MATFYVTHHLYPDNPQLFTVTIKQVVKIAGEPGTDFHYDHRGESYWEIFVYTTGVDIAGDEIPPILIDVRATESTVDEMVATKVAQLCSRIDWSAAGDFSIGTDKYAPMITEQYPAPGQTDVPLNSTIKIVVKELLPAKGMDISSISMKVKDIPVTPTVEGNPYDYTITFTPKVAR